jgi:single-strand DNA-binding protein
MSDMNHVNLTGRLIRDAELKNTANGQLVSMFSIAINPIVKHGEKIIYHFKG